jgi:hypothetical protein
MTPARVLAWRACLETDDSAEEAQLHAIGELADVVASRTGRGRASCRTGRGRHHNGLIATVTGSKARIS